MDSALPCSSSLKSSCDDQRCQLSVTITRRSSSTCLPPAAAEKVTCEIEVTHYGGSVRKVEKAISAVAIPLILAGQTTLTQRLRRRPARSNHFRTFNWKPGSTVPPSRVSASPTRRTSLGLV